MKNIKLGVRALIKTNKGLIMVEHNEKINGNILIFPGGGIESGESIFEAAERETKEETNLIVKAEKIIYIREILHGDISGIEFYVSCSLVSGDLILGTDPELKADKQILRAVREVDWEEIKNNKWYPKELHGRLKGDLKNNTSNVKYLGIKIF